jgi:hypothetical protein
MVCSSLTVRQLLTTVAHHMSLGLACRYTCFNAPADVTVPATPQQQQAEALAAVQGWSWRVAECIKATPVEGLSRGRIADR